MPAPPRFADLAWLVLAVLCLSTAILCIKLSRLPPLELTAYRLLLAVLILAPWCVRAWRQHRAALTGSLLRSALLPAACFGAHLVTWVIGARLTQTANASLAVNMVPVVLPVFLFVIARERITRRELVGTAVATAGILVLLAGDLRLAPEHFQGDLLCLGSMLLLALYFATGRRVLPRFPSVWIYIGLVYLGAALFPLLILWGSGRTPTLPRAGDWPVLLTLAAVPTVIGHSLMNRALRRLRGQIVSVFNQTQFLFAGLAAYPLFGTLPGPAFVPASLLVVAGALLTLTGPAQTRV